MPIPPAPGPSPPPLGKMSRFGGGSRGNFCFGRRRARLHPIVGWGLARQRAHALPGFLICPRPLSVYTQHWWPASMQRVHRSSPKNCTPRSVSIILPTLLTTAWLPLYDRAQSHHHFPTACGWYGSSVLPMEDQSHETRS
jgi:hypothetical protein